MKAPDFWFHDASKPGFFARLLSPLGALYAAATARRLARTSGEHLSKPVICVGNINAGGTGKTPTVIALTQLIQARGKTAHVVSRGHGGTLAGPVRVVETDHTAAEVGDEPLLLSAFAPMWVAKDRAAGARAAIAAGADVILLDDGFQNPNLHKDFSLIVVDAKQGFGNGRCIPAGPLREPVNAGLKRGDMVLSIGDDDAQNLFNARWGNSIKLPRLKGELTPLPTGMDWEGLPVLAFAGIGQPSKFFNTLQQLGANIIHAEALSDHQPLTTRLMQRLLADAKTHGAQLVTTEKDAVRLPAVFRQDVLTLPVRLSFSDVGPLEAALDRLISG